MGANGKWGLEFLNYFKIQDLTPRNCFSGCNLFLLPKDRRGHVKNLVTLLVFIVPLISGCAGIIESAANHVADEIKCHNKCPGGSAEAERKCREECLRELSAGRERSRRLAEEERHDREAARNREESTRRMLEEWKIMKERQK